MLTWLRDRSWLTCCSMVRQYTYCAPGPVTKIDSCLSVSTMHMLWVVEVSQSLVNGSIVVRSVCLARRACYSCISLRNNTEDRDHRPLQLTRALPRGLASLQPKNFRLVEALVSDNSDSIVGTWLTVGTSLTVLPSSQLGRGCCKVDIQSASSAKWLPRLSGTGSTALLQGSVDTVVGFTDDVQCRSMTLLQMAIIPSRAER